MEAANSELKEYLERRKPRDGNDWPLQIGRYLTGKLTETDFLEAANSPNQQTAKEQRCEACYYVGSKRLVEGDHTGAAEYFKKCTATNLTDFEEYQSAASELLQLDMPVQNLK
jgi:lipoprotein NlpI